MATLDAPVAALVAAARRLLDLAAALDPSAAPIEAAGVRLEPPTGKLSWPGGVAVLPPMLAALAGELMRAPGEVVARAVLLRAMGFWAAPSLTRRLEGAISRLRRSLPGRIASVKGYGYRWVPPV